METDSTPSPLSAIAFAFALLASLAACSRGDDEKRLAGERMLRTIDALVSADNASKAAPLAALEATPCQDPPACKARDTCVTAFRSLVRSVTVKDEVRAAMRAPGAAASVDALSAKVADAEAAQKSAEASMPACLSATAEARRVYTR